MRWILTVLIFLLGLFDLFLALSFLLNPAETARGFGLIADGARGLSSLRGDYLSFFGVTAGCMMWGAWRRNGDLLLVPAALMGVVFLARIFSLSVDGTYEAWHVPMVVEFLHVALLIVAWRLLPHHKLEEVAG